MAILSRKSLHFRIVSSVGFACSDASALNAVSSLPFIARAKKRKNPATSWMNLVPALSSFGDSFVHASYCALAPYMILTCGYG